MRREERGCISSRSSKWRLSLLHPRMPPSERTSEGKAPTTSHNNNNNFNNFNNRSRYIKDRGGEEDRKNMVTLEETSNNNNNNNNSIFKIICLCSNKTPWT